MDPVVRTLTRLSVIPPPGLGVCRGDVMAETCGDGRGLSVIRSLVVREPGWAMAGEMASSRSLVIIHQIDEISPTPGF